MFTFASARLVNIKNCFSTLSLPENVQIQKEEESCLCIGKHKKKLSNRNYSKPSETSFKCQNIRLTYFYRTLKFNALNICPKVRKDQQKKKSRYHD